jgi:predicted metal-dependent hydrolase
MSEQFRHSYCLIRSQRRTLALEIRPEGGLIVRAPKRLPLSEIERFISSKSGWIHKHLNRMRPLPSPMDPGEEKRLREAAVQQLPDVVEGFSKRMGVRPAYMRVTSAKKRLGSCNAKGGICFSYRLMAYPVEVIDYVVVHELAHLVHLNHSKNFYQVVARVMPDFRARMKILKRFAPVC